MQQPSPCSCLRSHVRAGRGILKHKAYMWLNVHTCVHTRNTHTHTNTHKHTHTHTHTTDWACTTCSDLGFLFLTLFLQIVHVYECTYLCAQTCTHTYTHTHTYTCTTCSDYFSHCIHKVCVLCVCVCVCVCVYVCVCVCCCVCAQVCTFNHMYALCLDLFTVHDNNSMTTKCQTPWIQR